MDINLYRFTHDNDSSLSLAHIGDAFECFGLEDEPREEKLVNETRIAEGRYKVIVRTAGRLHNKYSDRFTFHKGMLWLQDVPEFEYIYIHYGNYENETSGCILVGSRSSIDLLCRRA